MLILIKGAGDLATGVGAKLHNCGHSVIMTELQRPTTVRCHAAFSRAVYQGKCSVDGVEACFASNALAALRLTESGRIAILLHDDPSINTVLHPAAVIDAIVAKRNIGTTINDAPCVIALGPGFYAGRDCHAVIETLRGHDLGRVIYQGEATPNTSQPGLIDGLTEERILRAPCDGLLAPLVEIGESVQKGQLLATVCGQPILARTAGVVRGLLPAGTPVHQGMKSGDVDPRNIAGYCYTVSDKARCIAGGVLEALYHLTTCAQTQLRSSKPSLKQLRTS